MHVIMHRRFKLSIYLSQYQNRMYFRMDVTHWLLTALLAALIREYRSHSHSHGHVNPEDRPTGFHDPKVVHDTE